MPQDDGFDAGKIGEQYGGYVGKIAGAISDVAKSDQSKSKIDEYVMAYNNPNDDTIFAGLKGALRTEKLARLLQPLDADLADTYQKKAQAEKNRETMLADNQTVVDARKGVQSTGDDDLDESKRMTAGAEALMRFNPESGMATLEKGRALADKASNAKDSQEAKKAALESVDVATRLWQEKRDDQSLTADLYRAMSDARALGVSVKDPIADYRSEQLAGSTIASTTSRDNLANQQAEFNRKMQEEGLKLDQDSLTLQRSKFAADQQKTAIELANKKGGEPLDSTSIAQLSNLQTVLASIEEIKDAFDRFKNSNGLTDKYSSWRDLSGSAMLGSENLGRVQSGGAISGDELKTFKTLISPQSLDYLDGGDSYLKNVAKLKAAIENKMENFSTKGRGLTNGTPAVTSPSPIKPASKPGIPPLAPRVKQ
jgi:hypothetical protein